MELAVPGPADAPDLQAIEVRRLSSGNGHLWEQAVLPLAVAGGLLNLCNTAPLVLRRQIVCMHDVTFRLYPDSYTPAFRRAYSLLIPALGRRAAAITTVSEYSAQQLSRWGGVRPDKITLHPNGHEHATRWLPAHDEVTRMPASFDTIVILGSRAPHKNVDMILDMADELGRAGLMIALVGSLDQRVFRQGSGALPPNVRALGRLPDEALAALLSGSLCLAFPSLTEGFGLPPLEAMAIGCPVVVSDRGSLPEICGDAALYASPSDPREWLSAFLRLRSDVHLRSDLVRRGKERAAGFSWRETAVRYLMLMARLDSVAG
jgi:glycosyltransferase involved in cell wall biosynthesis